MLDAEGKQHVCMMQDGRVSYTPSLQFAPSHPETLTCCPQASTAHTAHSDQC